jgi:hypothetical protein
MTRQEQFITMVAAMRQAQRKYTETRIGKYLVEAQRYEAQVDDWLRCYVAEKVQLDFWDRSVKSSEEPGAYNVGHGEEKTKNGAA